MLTGKERVFSKNLIPLCVLHILQDHSDQNHLLTQEDIIRYLHSEYGVESIERKAIGRALDGLMDELDINIFRSKKGCYLEKRTFEDSELQMLIDSVYGSRFIPANHSKKIIDKLLGLGNEYFKHNVRYVSSMDNLSKVDNNNLLANIELVSCAIEKHLQIQFDYSKYQSDMKLHISSKDHITSPYRLVVKNQDYYVMMYHEKHQKIVFYRLSHMQNLKVLENKKGTSLRSIPDWEGGVNNKTFINRPYLFADKPEKIMLLVDADAFDHVISWLGRDVMIDDISNADANKVKIIVTSSPNAMKYLAMQFASCMEVLSPESLRETVKVELERALKKY